MNEFIDSITSVEITRCANNLWWKINVEATSVPSGIDFVYEAKPMDGDSLGYVGYCGEWMSTFVHNPSNQRGFGGHVFTLRMKDTCELVDIKGPWSGRPSVYMAAGFEAHMDVVVTNHCRTVYQLSRTGVEAILAKFNLPFHLEIGPLWDGDDEDSLFLVANDPNMRGRIDKDVSFVGIPAL